MRMIGLIQSVYWFMSRTTSSMEVQRKYLRCKRKSSKTTGGAAPKSTRRGEGSRPCTRPDSRVQLACADPPSKQKMEGTEGGTRSRVDRVVTLPSHKQSLMPETRFSHRTPNVSRIERQTLIIFDTTHSSQA
ncbi:hypothetical protein B0H66DRAFT_102459 [Apodospora peruviana]|uniref:Uncharacterized protein n=1 Tax=Apodospora peruviana TaxID=516989 RepID=A0AAE0HS94_9PEZI|nr:hypothetical protein B0H66DRAFT_102459 [Apodospora peruviana]